ncbi:hypothetical protein WJX82_010748 [Trebouxia sp. C0006]
MQQMATHQDRLQSPSCTQQTADPLQSAQIDVDSADEKSTIPETVPDSAYSSTNADQPDQNRTAAPEVTATVSRKRVAAMIDLTSDDIQMAPPVHPNMPRQSKSRRTSEQDTPHSADTPLHVLSLTGSPRLGAQTPACPPAPAARGLLQQLQFRWTYKHPLNMQRAMLFPMQYQAA